GLRAHPVADRHDRKPRRVRTTVIGMGRGRTGRALAPAEHVGAHHEVLVGVERLPRTDELIPPAGRRMAVDRRAGGMAVTRARMADEDGVAGVYVERPPRLLRHCDLAEQTAALPGETPRSRDA